MVVKLGNSLSNSNFNLEKYNNYFKGDLCYPDVQGYEGGRYIGCSMEIEGLRPRSPPRQQVNPLVFAPPVTPGLNNLNIPLQNSSGSLNIGNIPLGANINVQNDFNINRMVNNLNDVNNGINKGVNVNQMMNVNPMIPMNFPLVNQINQMQNMGNIQRNNMSNIPQNINNINNINRTNY